MSGHVMDRVAEVAPRVHAFLMKTAQEVRQSPFSSEILDELDCLIKKTAQGPTGSSLLGRMGQGAVGGAGALGMAALSGVAYALAGDMYDAVKRGITKGRNYRSMLQENPDLQEMDSKTVQKTFSTLHKFNPEFASDPTVAGLFVRNHAQLGGLADIKQLTELVGARKNLVDTKKLPGSPAKLEGRQQQGQANPLIDELHQDMMSRRHADDLTSGMFGGQTVRGAPTPPQRFYPGPGGRGQRTTP